MSTKFIVLTGGPGAGKTAVLELAKQRFSLDVAFLPEAASILFSGGFWRLPSISARKAAQRAIYHVQSEMQKLVEEQEVWKFGICDRGTIDGLAFWPTEESDFWKEIASSKLAEFKRYAAVIHLRTPSLLEGYNQQNRLRVETAEEANLIDQRIASIWSSHPHYIQVPNSKDFTDKAFVALELIQKILSNGTR